MQATQTGRGEEDKLAKVAVPTVQQSGSVIRVYIHILLYILLHYSLSQDLEYSSLCSIVVPKKE